MTHSSPAIARRASLTVLAALAFFQPGITAQQAAKPVSRTTGLTLSPSRLTRVDRVLQRYVDDQLIPGAVALVLQMGSPCMSVPSAGATKRPGGA